MKWRKVLFSQKAEIKTIQPTVPSCTMTNGNLKGYLLGSDEVIELFF